MGISHKVENFGSWKKFIFSDDQTGYLLSICDYGATVTEFSRSYDHKKKDIIVPYQTPEQLTKAELAANQIMAPFTNKLSANQYYFNDKVYHLDAESGFIHGFVSRKIFRSRIVKSGNDEYILEFSYEHTGLDFPAYPFPFTMSITYIVRGNGFAVTLRTNNTGPTDMPFGCGWHPYFSLKESSPEDILLSIPSRTIIRTDNNLIPYPEKYEEELPDSHHLNYYTDSMQEMRSPGNTILNSCYTNLLKDPEKKIRSVLFNKRTREKLTVTQSDGVIYVFTPGDFRNGYGKVIAIEPVEFMTNVFNHKEHADSFTIKTGQSREFSFSVNHEVIDQ